MESAAPLGNLRKDVFSGTHNLSFQFLTYIQYPTVVNDQMIIVQIVLCNFRFTCSCLGNEVLRNFTLT